MRRFCTSLHYCTSQSGLSNAQLSWNKLNDTIHCKQYKIKYSTKSTLHPAVPFSNLNLGRLVKLSGEQVPDFSPCVLKYMKFPQKKHQFMKLGPAMYVGFHCSKSSIKFAMFAKRGGDALKKQFPQAALLYVYDSKFLQNVAALRSITGVFVISLVNVVARFTLWQLQISDYSLIWNVSRQRKLNLER